MSVRPLLVTGIAAAVLVGGAACTGGGTTPVAAGTPSASGTATTVPSASATPTDPAPTTPAATRPATPGATPGTSGCRATDVTVTVSTGQGAAGTLVQRFVVTNTGRATCTMAGRPALTLHGTGTAGLGVTAIPPGFGDLGDSGGTQTLRPGGTAAFFVTWNHVPSGDTPCPQVVGFDVTPPQGGTGSRYVTFGMDVCGGGVRVSEILPPSVGS